MEEQRERLWLHFLLLVLTLVSTTIIGAQFALDFSHNRPFLESDDLLSVWRLATDPERMRAGLAFSLPLLTVLLAHEMGHYVACRLYNIDASLPYFIPFPSLIGTLGAFIRIRSAMTTRHQLFDIGVAGPLAGFVFVLPLLAIGLAYSKVIPNIASGGEIVFSSPLVVRALEWLIFPGVPSSDIYFHPVARAAWVGVLATALNLMPVGQLDGGHILYSFFGRAHTFVTYLFIVALVAMGLFFSWSWLLWALLLLLFGRRHPRLYDETPMSRGRQALALLAMVIFLSSFSLTPVRTLLR